MKDSEVREKARFNELAIDYLTRRIEILEGRMPEVKDCPECKHPVLAITHPYRTISITNVHTGSGYTKVDDPCFQCLTCGTKFTCALKNVCEILKEKR